MSDSASVFYLPGHEPKEEEGPPVDPPGGGGDDGGMAELTERVAKIEAKLDAALPTLATKEEMHRGFHDQTKWIVGTAFAGAGLTIAVMTFVVNNATAKQQGPQQQPTVIVVPQPSAPASR